MNDLLYFNSVDVSIEDVKAVALQEGFVCRHEQADVFGPWLEVYHGEMISWGNTANPELRPDRWIFDYTSLDDYDVEEDAEVVRTYHPTIFMSVQYHVPYLCKLTAFLRRIIQQFGGWVYGADGKIHDALTVEQMQFITGDGDIYLDCGSEMT